jgi:hypothetical protein
MRKTMLAALLVTAASVLTVPAFAQTAAMPKSEASTTAGAAAQDTAKSADQTAAKSADTATSAGHKASKHSHKAKAAASGDATKTDGSAQPSGQ